MTPLETYCNRAHHMRTFAIEEEHILSNANVPYQMRTFLAQLKHTAINTNLNRYSIRKKKLSDANVFYQIRTNSIRQEHIL